MMIAYIFSRNEKFTWATIAAILIKYFSNFFKARPLPNAYIDVFTVYLCLS